ncbi:urea ABC transporter ATP-binding subunit UrtE [Hydrogenibacillus schlegelii]|uniref:Urea ABC transporter ATP-binding subunit UrtE n=1 Tax=Hydrogenibacillus schlegelii TaxID=1484 RepID=A0A132N418_HYDSH|nr:urea ABC transporter ATP-binding subunit UrtE [Hydrogenibacillus schlegelii]KWX04891.1 hypothetical protein TR75_08010 [Hydrogenibacillus schlegelii]OAR04400.1 urea ABC transporter ATP-binding subunit UrtE [Hydrogenibacillus schlegelii]
MLAVERVTAGYGEGRVLNGVSLAVPEGRVVCLMGRNGVGKTTLLQTIIGLLPATSGAIRLGDQDLTRLPPWERARAGIGYVPQGRGIFPFLTVRENLLVGQEVGRPDPVALEEVLELFPRLRDLYHRAGGALSGGQQQQLALARALVGRPRVLLLDEPTEGIQPSIVWEIEEVLQILKARGQVAILLVEQFVDFALSLGDYYYVMERGTIVAEGATGSADPAALQEYLSV